MDRSRVEQLVLLLQPGNLAAEIGQTGTAVHELDAGRVRNLPMFVKSVSEMTRLVRSLGISIIHSHNAKAHLYGGVAAILSHTPSVFHLHGVPRPSWSRDGLVSSAAMVVP